MDEEVIGSEGGRLVALALFLSLLALSATLTILGGRPTARTGSKALPPVATARAQPLPRQGVGPTRAPAATHEPLLALPALPAPPPAPAGRTHYRFVVRLDAAHHVAAVGQAVAYVNTSASPLPYLHLVVEPNRWPGAFTLASLTWGDGQPVAEYSLSGGRLLVVLPELLPPGASVVLLLTYHLAPPARAGVFGYTDAQMNLSDWYPFFPPYDEGAGWLANEPGAVGEHLAYEIADYEVEIEMVGRATGQTVAASAPDDAEGERQHYRQEATRNFTFSVGRDYRVRELSVGEVALRAYLFPEHVAAGEAALRATAQAVALYSKLFAPYPHPTLTLVEGDFGDGMEYDGLYFLGRDYFEDYDGTPRNYLTALAAHETAHQWWYGWVGNDQANEPWLDEAMATYSELLFYQTFYPDLTGWWWEYRVGRFRPVGRVGGSVYAHLGPRSYIDAVYLRGARFLHQVRELMGDEAFLASLAAYAARNGQRQATAADFFDALAAHGSPDLAPLIDDYFLR